MAKGKAISHAEVKEVLGRAIADPAFRKELLADPAKALKKAGFDPQEDAVRFFKALSTKTFDEAARHLAPKGGHDPIERAGEV